MRGRLTIPVAIVLSLGVLVIVIFALFSRSDGPKDTAFIEIARANATVHEIFQGKKHVVTSNYEGIMSIPDYECHIGRCILLVFSPAEDPEKQTVTVYVNKDTMKVADIRASEDYLITKATQSAEGRLFLSKYPNADISARLGYWHPEVTFGVSDSLYSLSMIVNTTYTGEVTAVSAYCFGHYDTVERIASNVMAYIAQENCVQPDKDSQR
jgi:hypothetical protein